MSKTPPPAVGELWQNAGYTENFAKRHIGPGPKDVATMAKKVGYDTIDALIDTVVPPSIRDSKGFDLPEYASEPAAKAELRDIMAKNKLFKNYLGTGYYDTITPAVIQRNILENPGWYTQYTPYQSEIAQGRLEALINFQTMVMDLTGFDIANASLLDEGTSAAEAMYLSYSSKSKKTSEQFLVSSKCHPQTIAVVETRTKALGIEVKLFDDLDSVSFDDKPFGILIQYPDTEGHIGRYEQSIEKAHAADCMVVMAADILSLCLLKSPGELGADIAVGTTQRFGVPLGYGGPHAGYIATKDKYKRKMPGRIVGVSKDRHGKKAYRLALATREQHIRRDKATSNICTAQVLLAIMSSMYAVFHGPKGLQRIATKVHDQARLFKANLEQAGLKVANQVFFDTLTIETGAETAAIYDRALASEINIRKLSSTAVAVSFDETTTLEDMEKLVGVFAPSHTFAPLEHGTVLSADYLRNTEYLSHPHFNSYHSETEMMRYIKKLELRDLSLAKSMIPLGSCTMKLNAASELMPVTWPTVNSLHPFAPLDQVQGYKTLLTQLEGWLAEVTGFDVCSLQPNSGAQGEFAGLMAIKGYHHSRGDDHRNICLIPSSAHGTNPASANIAGMKVVVVKCDDEGNIDQADLKAKAEKHKDNLSALMVTYPSTHGVFEEGFSEACKVIHDNGGQVYMDGANLQAQLTLCKAGELGPDVCHLNLHKTFCIPHGGGGPGVGPIAAKSHLADFMPSHPLVAVGGKDSFGPVSAAPYGSPSILPISWMYIRMMAEQGLNEATKVAILNANYIAKRLKDYYPVVYTGKEGLVAHECILDIRPLKKTAGVDEADVAKRLMDYGFHAPTVSWPVAGTLMVEPTESESMAELDRFCDAMISIAKEIEEIAEGKFPKDNNLLKNAPHTAEDIVAESWEHGYSRERAVYPLAWVKDYKFWPFVARIDNAYGDRHLVCSCPPLDQYED